MYNPKSKKSEEFISDEEILNSLKYAKENKDNLELINENNGLFYKYDNIDDWQHALEYMVDKVSNFHAENIANTAKRLYSCEISNAKIISFFKRVYKRDGYE